MTEESAAATGVHSLAHVKTASASRYLQQLCKHFQHKIPATFDEHKGEVIFSIGVCRLEADSNTLKMELTSPDADQLAQLQEVVASHLVRFAFREELEIAWQPA